jgi:hypothetical protein
MGGPSGRDLNPADFAVVVGRVSLFLPSLYSQPLKDIHTHPWPGGDSFLGKNRPPSVRFELTSAGTATSEHCLRQPCGYRTTFCHAVLSTHSFFYIFTRYNRKIFQYLKIISIKYQIALFTYLIWIRYPPYYLNYISKINTTPRLWQ